MNITSVFYTFPDQDACVEHLENVRWDDGPHCPHCGSTQVARKGLGGEKGAVQALDMIRDARRAVSIKLVQG